MRPRVVVLADRTLTSDDARSRRSARLYAEIARDLDVTVIARAPLGTQTSRVELAPGLFESRIARTPAEIEWHEIATRRWGPAGGDDTLWFDRAAALNPPLRDALESALSGAALAVCLRPYGYTVMRAVTTMPIVYDALELEYPARVAENLSTPNQIERLEKLARLEADCIRGAAAVITGDAESAELGSLLYDIEPKRFTLLPRTLDHNVRPVFEVAERNRRKAQTNLADKTIALFVGSAKPVNMREAILLSSIAGELGEVYFLVAGDVAGVFPPIKRPANLQFTGSVDASTLMTLFDIADVFVHPASEQRSHVARKALDAAAHGTPMVLTPQAAAGVFKDQVDADVASVPELAGRIRALLGDRSRSERQAQAARRTAEAAYSWREAITPIRGLIDQLRVDRLHA